MGSGRTEASIAFQLRPLRPDEEGDQYCSDSAGDDAEDRAEILGDDAGLEAAQFVRCADEETVDGRNAAALFVRRQQLHQRMANDDADVIGDSAHHKHRDG